MKVGKLMGVLDTTDSALGLPERLARNKDGSLRLRKNGETIYEVAKEVRNGGRTMMANVIATLDAENEDYRLAHEEAWNNLEERLTAAAAPLIADDKKLLDDTIAKMMAEAAKAKAAEEDRVKAEEARIKAEAEAAALAEKKAREEKELADTLAAEAAEKAATLKAEQEAVEVSQPPSDINPNTHPANVESNVVPTPVKKASLKEKERELAAVA